ncbi:MAG: hypothetical protein D6693_02415 [Planctomycetota bacterium]|nr:MAG: hypothetical protein D6693_02415 [Planctomycetota bacterium]
MLKNTLVTLVAVIATTAAAFVGATATAGAGDVKMEARLSGPTLASGKARYEERMKKNVLEQRFKVQIEDAAPNADFAVVVAGVTVGVITTNDLGMGELQLRTATFIDDPGDGSPIPTDFPQVGPGDSVSVGSDLSGSF